MDELRRRYRASLASRIAALETARNLVLGGNADGLAQARSVAHALAGSGATYGYPTLSDAGALLEDCPDSQLLQSLDALVGVVRSVASGELKPT